MNRPVFIAVAVALGAALNRFAGFDNVRGRFAMFAGIAALCAFYANAFDHPIGPYWAAAYGFLATAIFRSAPTWPIYVIADPETHKARASVAEAYLHAGVPALFGTMALLPLGEPVFVLAMGLCLWAVVIAAGVFYRGLRDRLPNANVAEWFIGGYWGGALGVCFLASLHGSPAQTAIEFVQSLL